MSTLPSLARTASSDGTRTAPGADPRRSPAGRTARGFAALLLAAAALIVMPATGASAEGDRVLEPPMDPVKRAIEARALAIGGIDESSADSGEAGEGGVAGLCSGNGANLLYPFVNDGTWTLALAGNDDGSTGLLPLGFTFDLFGSTFTGAHINNNGNLTFTGPFSAFTAQGFPVSGPVMVAPFWADVDTRPAASGKVWRKGVDSDGNGQLDTFVVTWDNVGYYNQQTDKRNTFQVVLTSGTNPVVGIGNNVAFSYDQMCWTTGSASGGSGGFGGTPATVGVNKGDGVGFFQIGLFNKPDDSYDGPGGQTDGIQYLTGKLFTFSVAESSNQPPIPVTLPPGPIAVQSGEPLLTTIEFISPEIDQFTTVAPVNPAALEALGFVLESVPGNPGSLTLSWVPGCCDAGTLTIPIVATDSFVPPATTTVSIVVEVSCGDGPDLAASEFAAPTAAFVSTPLLFSWTAENIGPGVASGQWADRIYLAPTPIFDGNAMLLASAQSTFAALQPGGSYQRTISAVAPATAGTFWPILVLDADGALCELTGGAANIAVADAPIVVTVPPKPDLVVTAVTTPSDGVVSGSTIKLSFTVQNIGTAPTNVPAWTDLVILSPDTSLVPPPQPLGSETILASVPNPQFLQPGESYVQNVDVTLPNDIFGTRYLAIYADGKANGPQGATFSIGELDETNNLLFSGAFVVELEPQPDLVVQTIGAPAIAFSGLPITVTATIANVGEAVTDTGTWQNQLWLSTNAQPSIGAGDILLVGASSSGPPLQPGQVRLVSFTKPLPAILSGEFFVKVFADSGNVVSEFGFEGNNVSAGPSPITVFQSPPVDLVPVAVEGPASPTTFPGHTIAVSWTGINKGAPPLPGPVLSWSDGIYLSTDQALSPDDVLLGTRPQTSTFVNGQPAIPDYVATRSVKIPESTAAGSYHLIVVLDVNQNVFEGECPDACESNNALAAAAPILVEPLYADLVLENASAPPAGVAGGTIPVAWSVRNAGDVVTPVDLWSDRIFLSSDASLGGDVQMLSVTRSGALAPGAAYDRAATAIVPLQPPGDYFLLFVADGAGQVFEGPAGESNNLVALPFSIAADASDLVVQSVAGPASVDAGAQITASWTVANVGTLPTNVGSWIDRVWLSPEPSVVPGAILLGARSHTGTLGVGAAYSQSLTATVPLGAGGVRHLVVRTDDGNAVFEQNEANNVGASESLIVAPPVLPNLTVASVVRTDEGLSGQPLAVTWTVQNQSENPLASSTWRDSVYLSLDAFLDIPGDLPLGTVTRSGSLAPGEGYSESANFTVPLGFSGTFFAIVVTDSLGQIAESDELDNVAAGLMSTTILLPEPSDLVVASVGSQRPRLVLGQSYVFGREIANAGDNEIVGQWKDSLYLSDDPEWSLDDRRIGTFSSAASAGDPFLPGTSRSFSGPATIPGVLPGRYWLVARTDVFNSIPETDETNNLGVSRTPVEIGAIPLELGVEYAGTLATGTSLYFEFDAPAGEAVLVALDHASPVATTELFVSFGQVPSSGNFDFLGGSPGEADQSLLIPSTSEGRYYVLARAVGGTFVPGGTEFTIRAEIVPFGVATVKPTSVGNVGSSTIEIGGARFDEATEFFLRRSGVPGASPIEASWTLFESNAKARVTFDLGGTAPGSYDLIARSEWTIRDIDINTFEVIVVDAAVSEFVAEGAITVVAGGGPNLRTTLLRPNSVLLNAAFSMQLEIANEGLSDAKAPILQVASPNGTPIAASASGVGSGGSQQHFVVAGRRRADVIGPGESFVVPLFSRATVPGVASFVVQNMESLSGPIDWPLLEPYYRASRAGTAEFDWATTWANLVALAGDSWPKLHAAMRRAASERHAASGRQVFDGAEIMADLLARAARGQDAFEEPEGAARRFGRGFAFLGSPFPPGSEGGIADGSCQNNEANCPRIGDVEAAAYRVYLSQIITYYFLPAFGVDVATLWSKYIWGVGGSFLFDDENSRIVKGFRSHPQTTGEEAVIAGEVAQWLSDNAEMLVGCDSFAGGAFTLPLSFILDQPGPGPNSILRIINYGDFASSIPGNLAGGTDFNFQVPPDFRRADGVVEITRIDDECGNPKSLEAVLKISWTIGDTLDFCPGNLAIGFCQGPICAEYVTVPFCKLEASGYAKDVIYQVKFDAEERPLQVPVSLDCDDDCPPQPPASDCAEPCEPRCPEGGGSGNDGGGDCDGPQEDIPVVASVDPNEKAGPTGFGPEGWVSAVSPLSYRIDFENLPDATAPAARVEIVDPLDSSLNPASVRLGGMVVSNVAVTVPEGLISFQTQLDLIAEQGVLVDITAGVNLGANPPTVFWIFQAIDPATGEPPVTGEIGLLPPEDGTGAGQGYVTFSVRPKLSAPDGTVIANDASIVFDANPPLITNTVVNTIDRNPPSSSVLPLPPVTLEPALIAEIVAADAPGGSGVATVALFVSVDGAAFAPASTFGTSTSVPFSALESGRVYGFASQAIDHAGVIESLPASPDTVVAVPAVGLAPESDTGILGDGITSITSPILRVVSAPFASVAIEVIGRRGTLLTSAETGGGGVGFAPVGPLADGIYQLRATSFGLTVTAPLLISSGVGAELSWNSLRPHAGVGPTPVPLPPGTVAVEPRIGGIERIEIDVIDALGCLGPVTAALVSGIGLDGFPVVPGSAALIGALDDRLGWSIEFVPPLSAAGIYCVRLDGAADCAGNALPDELALRTVVVLPGDATGDRRVNNTDVGAILSLLGTLPIDPGSPKQVRSDLNLDGAIDAIDVQLAMDARGTDARFIAIPCATPTLALVDDAALRPTESADARLSDRSSRPTSSLGSAAAERGLPSTAEGVPDPSGGIGEQAEPRPESSHRAVAVLLKPDATVERVASAVSAPGVHDWGDGWWILEDAGGADPGAMLRNHPGVRFAGPVDRDRDGRRSFRTRTVLAVTTEPDEFVAAALSGAAAIAEVRDRRRPDSGASPATLRLLGEVAGFSVIAVDVDTDDPREVEALARQLAEIHGTLAVEIERRFDATTCPAPGIDCERGAPPAEGVTGPETARRACVGVGLFVAGAANLAELDSARRGDAGQPSDGETLRRAIEAGFAAVQIGRRGGAGCAAIVELDAYRAIGDRSVGCTVDAAAALLSAHELGLRVVIEPAAMQVESPTLELLRNLLAVGFPHGGDPGGVIVIAPSCPTGSGPRESAAEMATLVVAEADESLFPPVGSAPVLVAICSLPPALGNGGGVGAAWVAGVAAAIIDSAPALRRRAIIDAIERLCDGRWDPDLAPHRPCLLSPEGVRRALVACDDIDAGGAVDARDVAALLVLWSRGDPRADLDGDGAITADDLRRLLEQIARLEAAERK
ncbi:MAG TPA: CARDB domain-containing protein [Phycisphaerales bacterium]|nr:CARDB domain-containing protein [Phycisphaerales bacterium]HMP38355.1 CARDB domain-containing protein [Phycisphaerales bacterium]